MTSPRYVSAAEVVAYHRTLLSAQGQPVAALINPEKLNAAVARPQSMAFGSDLFGSPAEKAAALLQAIVVGHPFLDGNKRAGLGAMLLFLELNGVDRKADENDLYELVMSVAAGQLRDVGEIANRIRKLFALD